MKAGIGRKRSRQQEETFLAKPGGHYELMSNRESVLITGGLGFIGLHLAKDLLEQGYSVVGGLDILDMNWAGLLKKCRHEPSMILVFR